MNGCSCTDLICDLDAKIEYFFLLRISSCYDLSSYICIVFIEVRQVLDTTMSGNFQVAS